MHIIRLFKGMVFKESFADCLATDYAISVAGMH